MTMTWSKPCYKSRQTTRRSMKFFVGAALAGATALLAGAAAAQGFPVKPIRLIVPGSPGAGADVPARVLATALGDDPGWRVVVENRAGATGRIGTELVAKSPSDGY